MQTTRALSTMISLEKTITMWKSLLWRKKQHVKAGKQAGYNKHEEKTGLDKERKIT